MDSISIGVAFSAGIISFLSPCVLPLVPGYISFLSGLSLEELQQKEVRKNILKKAGLTSIIFVFGFSSVFVTLGASASFIGKFLLNYRWLFTKIVGVIIIILGMHFLGIFRIKWLNQERRLNLKRISSSPWGAFLLGLGFAFGWIPCIGPILSGILGLAATQQTVEKGISLLTAYSLGLGIPFIIAGFAMGLFISFFERYKKFIKIGEVIAGIILIGIGLFIFFDNMIFLIRFIPDYFNRFIK